MWRKVRNRRHSPRPQAGLQARPFPAMAILSQPKAETSKIANVERLWVPLNTIITVLEPQTSDFVLERLAFGMAILLWPVDPESPRRSNARLYDSNLRRAPREYRICSSVIKGSMTLSL